MKFLSRLTNFHVSHGSEFSYLEILLVYSEYDPVTIREGSLTGRLNLYFLHGVF